MPFICFNDLGLELTYMRGNVTHERMRNFINVQRDVRDKRMPARMFVVGAIQSRYEQIWSQEMYILVTIIHEIIHK